MMLLNGVDHNIWHTLGGIQQFIHVYARSNSCKETSLYHTTKETVILLSWEKI